MGPSQFACAATVACDDVVTSRPEKKGYPAFPPIAATAARGSGRRGGGRRRRFGDSYDNALAETVNGLYKAELIHRRGPWRSFEAVEFATLGWVDWFNHRRLLEPIGNIPPAEAEDRYYAMLEQTPMAA